MIIPLYMDQSVNSAVKVKLWKYLKPETNYVGKCQYQHHHDGTHLDVKFLLEIGQLAVSLDICKWDQIFKYALN